MARLLIMDDDLGFSFDLSMELQRNGYEVDVCRDAPEAWEMIKRNSYDLLLTDIFVREDGKPVPKGGISLIGMVRNARINRSNNKPLPIIAMTAAAHHPGLEAILGTAAQLGADATYAKPLPVEEVIHDIAILLAPADPKGR